MTMFYEFIASSGWSSATPGHGLMVIVGLIMILLAIIRRYEPLLLVPMGFGVILGNIPMPGGEGHGVYDEGSVLYYIYFGVKEGIFPALIFLGIGAMTDFSAMFSAPRLVLLGAAAQIGIFVTMIGAMAIGFTPEESGAIAIIGLSLIHI